MSSRGVFASCVRASSACPPVILRSICPRPKVPYLCAEFDAQFDGNTVLISAAGGHHVWLAAIGELYVSPHLFYIFSVGSMILMSIIFGVTHNGLCARFALHCLAVRRAAVPEALLLLRTTVISKLTHSHHRYPRVLH